jgi:hypothetical protein
MPEQADEPFDKFSGRLIEALTKTQPHVPPAQILGRLWLLAGNLELRYVDFSRKSGGSQIGTLWRVVLSDGDAIVYVIGEHPTNAFWTYGDQARDSTSAGGDDTAIIMAVRRRVGDIVSVETRGTTPGWVIGEHGPANPSFALVWNDGFEIGLPLMDTPTRVQILELLRFVSAI